MDRTQLIRLLGAEPAAGAPRDVVVDAREPARFIGAFTEAVAAGGSVFLADPQWSQTERTQFNALIQPAGPVASDRSCGRGWLCIPTGGSAGQVKLARHDEGTLSAAVTAFCTHFGVTQVNGVGLLPLHHVSGLMGWMRTVLTGGTYLPVEWKAVEAGARPVLPGMNANGFVSLVPTQLQRLLGDPGAEAWLREFRAVLVGGGPVWPGLIEAAAQARLPLAFSYGLTETAAMIAGLRPEEFLAGARGCGAVLPHARIELGEGGRVSIEGSSLFHGYWPAWRTEGPLLTEDCGRFDESGSLHILGRRDALIITGGEKVDPAEVEHVLRGTGQFADVAVVGVPDPHWGEIVVAFYPAEFVPHDLAGVARVLDSHLAGFKHPKRYVAIDRWPRNAQGKVNREALRGAVDRAPGNP